jgi:hypothetical protein
MLARRVAAIEVLLTILLGAASGCGGQAHATSSMATTRVPLETVAHHRRCPASDARLEASPEPATATVLVPAHPTGALICRYWGMSDPGHREASLAGTLTIPDAVVAEHLALRLDALPPFPTDPAPSCPAFGGRSVVIFFHYHRASDDPVRIKREGCVPVSNGRLLRIGLSLPGRHWPDEGLVAGQEVRPHPASSRTRTRGRSPLKTSPHA